MFLFFLTKTCDMKTKFTLFFTLLFVFFAQLVSAQKTVSGTVADDTGPLVGAYVLIQGTNTGTETNFDGKYSIKVKEGDVLQFSFIGFEPTFVAIGKDNTYDVVMKSTLDNILEEVVVIGYGVQKKSAVTGSISKIKASETQGLVTPSLESHLSGKAAGVQVTTNNGILGEAPRIRIRGIASINSGTYPLIIVDGMPVYTGDLDGYASTNALGDINPSDIESFEILKDGAATAIYGSRAANGVILITTKKGKNGKMEVNYSTVFGYANPIKTFDLLKTADFLVIANEKRTNAGQAPWAIGDEYDTDWQGSVLNKNAAQIDHNLSLNGGTDKTRYFLSMGYTDQNGIAKANDMNRYTFRTNLEHNVFKWLAIGGNISYTRTVNNGLNTGRNSLSGNIFNTTRQLPNTPIYNEDHPTGYNLSANNTVVGQWDNTDPVGDNITNIVYVLDHNKYYSKINRTIASGYITADIIKGLNYRFQANIDNPITNGFLYWNPTHGDGSSVKGRLHNNNADYLRWNVQNIVTYDKTFFDKHNFNLTGVAEYQKEKNKYFYGIGLGILDEFYNNNLIDNAYTTQQSGGSVTEVGLISYIGRLNYNFNEKYFLQASFRRDGISKLSPENRWNNFTGFSAGWNIAKENFMSELNDIVSEFKVRGSYSQVGNTEIGTYPYLSLTSPSSYAGENGIAFSQLGNDQLLWETSVKTDFGLDLSLFENKINFSFDFFKNDINGLIMQVPVPHSLGVPNNRIKKNIGDMYNKGYEFSADYHAFSKGNFKWIISANLTLEDNKVTSIPQGQDILGGTSTDININPNIIIREGESINAIYGFNYWGVNPANGNPVYYKADGSLVQGNISNQKYFKFNPDNPSDMTESSSLDIANDKVILGSTLPKYFGSFNNKFSYKSFDLSIFCRFSGGNKIFNATRRELMTQNFNNNGTEILGRWQSPENPGDGLTPRLYAASAVFANLTGHATTRFLEDGDFLNVEILTFGYTIPKVITKKVNINSIRLFVQGQNLLTFTKYTGLNPEMETNGVDYNGTPRSKVVSMGLNVNF